VRVEAFDLAGGRWRPWLGQSLRDAVFPTDAFEEHLDRLWAMMPSAELPAVVGQHLRGHPVATHRRSKRLAYRAAGGHNQYRGDHDEARVVIDTGQQLALTTVGQRQPTNDVDLPQMHRRFPLPTLVFPLVQLRLRVDKPVAGQHSMHRRPRRRRLHVPLTEFISDSPRTPARMGAAQLADQRLNFGGQPPRAVHRPARPVRQPGHALLFEALLPGMQ
jgi:hypothetical protein